jgi:hypothetical protein
MRRSWILVAGAILTLLLGRTEVRADPITWTYNWTPSATVIHSDSPGSGKLILTAEPGGLVQGSSDVVATNIRTFSNADASSPDHFTNSAYGLTISLLDKSSGATGTLTFTGNFNGTLSAQSSNLSNTFTGLTTQTLVLGTNQYTVTMIAFAPPGPPDSVNAGSITAHAQVSVQSLTGPEPSGMVLAGLGLSLCGVASWWRRRLNKSDLGVA